MTEHIAQFNVARAKFDLKDPRMAEFAVSVDRVNDAADHAPGFVWRLDDDSGYMNSVPDDPRMILNLSVWETIGDLKHYVWNTLHRRFYVRKREWFEVLGGKHFVMWKIQAGERPDLDEGRARLEHLREHGPTLVAFGWESIRAPFARLHDGR